MNQLVYPEDGSANTAKAMADAIRSQVAELQTVTKEALNQTDLIKTELNNSVKDFAKLVKTLDNYSSKTIVELSEGVKTIIQQFDYVTEKSQDSTKTIRDNIGDFSSLTNNFENNFSTLLNKIIPHIQELKTTSSLLQSINDENSNKLEKANVNLIQFSDRATQNIDNLTQIVDAQCQKLEHVANDASIVCGL